MKPSKTIEDMVGRSSVATPPLVVNTTETRLNQLTLYINAILEYLDGQEQANKPISEAVEKPTS